MKYVTARQAFKNTCDEPWARILEHRNPRVIIDELINGEKITLPLTKKQVTRWWDLWNILPPQEKFRWLEAIYDYVSRSDSLVVDFFFDHIHFDISKEWRERIGVTPPPVAVRYNYHR